MTLYENNSLLIHFSLIILNCFVTPYSMAFPYMKNYFIFDWVINILFLIDIGINFLTATYDQDYHLNDDIKSKKNIN
jgi:hypothetical protein